MLPSIIQLGFIWFLPESPRWLIAHDQADEAMAALKQYHGEGEETELVHLEFEEINAAIAQEKCEFLAATSNSKSKLTEYLHSVAGHNLEVAALHEGKSLQTILDFLHGNVLSVVWERIDIIPLVSSSCKFGLD